MNPVELEAMLRLSCVPHLGTVQLGRLLEQFRAASSLLQLPCADLGPWGFERDSPDTRRRVERALRVIDELGVRVWSILDDDYPHALRSLDDPPPLLFARGDERVLEEVGVAIVGTRSPTEYGASVSHMFAHGLAAAGIVVWSGGARGIDAIAHRAALDAGGRTVAVLGCGIDVVYPREHGALYEAIARDGVLLTEFMPGVPPLAHHFPRRNRLLARMPARVLIVEARVDGGALITAEQAAEWTDVLAVPGPIGRSTSTGTNRLIQDGARLVMEVADVIESLGGPLNAAAGKSRPTSRKRWTRIAALKKSDYDVQQPALGETRTAARPRTAARTAPAPVLDPESAGVLALLEPHIAIHIDDLLPRSGLPLPTLLGTLLSLINLGLVEDTGGRHFKRAAPRPRRVA